MHTPRTYVVDLTHFLDDDGSIGPKVGRARRLAEYFAQIVVVATSPYVPNRDPVTLNCRRRPGRRPWQGRIEMDIDPDTEQIVWWCPVCGEEGSISNWKGSLWDRSASGHSH